LKIGDTLGAGDAQFRAFVSYSHADAAIAKKLHRKMETYKLPKLLREMQTGGSENGRLGRLFRDREDLPAALDLSESVKAALAQSRALIVLCSPNAKDSPWVAKEIALFRELHPDRPILAALVDGEPEESFPEALLEGGEPLAADLRKQGDGWRLGLLKLIAGVAEVPLDALVQRDAQRHIRSVMAVTGGVLVALLAMIGMTTYALQQRNEAQHQQAQAEGLVEYMLTDLRSELKGASTLRVMTKVNERAMDYYEDQGDLSGMSADSLERRARILHAMGEDEVKRNDRNLDRAQKIFKEAHAATAALSVRDPNNAQRIFGHAQSEYWMGYIAYLNEDWPETGKHWRSYRKLADALADEDDQNRQWLREAGLAEGNLCTLALGQFEKKPTSLKSCKNALNRMEEVLELDPTDVSATKDVINRIGWLSTAYELQEKNKDRVELLIKGERLTQGLIDADPQNLDHKDIWLTFQIALLSIEGHASAERLQDALKIAQQLVDHDPENRDWQRRLAEISDLDWSNSMGVS